MPKVTKTPTTLKNRKPPKCSRRYKIHSFSRLIFLAERSISEISDVDNDDSWFSKFFYMIKVVKSSATQPSALKKVEKLKCSRRCKIHSTPET